MTNLTRLDELWDIGKTILRKAFENNLLTRFSRNASTHLEDIQQDKKANGIYQASYLTMAYIMLKTRMKYLKGKLSEIAYVCNLKTQNAASVVVKEVEELARSVMMDFYNQTPTTKEKLDRLGGKNVSSNRYSSR